MLMLFLNLRSAITLIGLVSVAPWGVAQDKGNPKAGEGGPDAPQAVEIYTAPDKSFELMYPADWKVTPGKAPGPLVTMLDEHKPPAQREALTVVAVPATPGQRLEDYAKTFKSGAARRIQGYHRVDDGMWEIGDWKVFRAVYDTQGQNGIPLRHINFAMIKDGVLYNLIFACPPDKLQQEHDFANQICGSFKVNAPPKFEGPATRRAGAAK
jgi:hypothetical protein